MLQHGSSRIVASKSRKRNCHCPIFFAMAVALVLSPGLTDAQQPQTDEREVVTQWRLSYISGGQLVEYGVYPTEKAAYKAWTDWADRNPYVPRMWRVDEIEVRVPRPRPRPQQPSPPPLSAPSVSRPTGGIALANSTWKGKEDLGGYGDVSFAFRADKTVTMTDKDGESEGKWQLVGNQLTMFFYDGNVVYTGKVAGKVIDGRASNGRSQWKWNVGTPDADQDSGKEQPAQAGNSLKLSGTTWEINGMSFGLRIMEFGNGNRVTGRFNVEANPL